MAFTQQDLDALDRALKTGAKRVTYNGKTVEYRDLSEIQAVRDEIASQLAGGQGDPPIRHYRVTARKDS